MDGDGLNNGSIEAKKKKDVLKGMKENWRKIKKHARDLNPESRLNLRAVSQVKGSNMHKKG